MTEEEKNIEWICSRTLLDKKDELVPIILKLVQETYRNGLKQGHFDRDMEYSNPIQKLKKHNTDLLRKLRNRVKEVKKLEKYSLYKKEFARLNKQLENKEQIINEAYKEVNNVLYFDDSSDYCSALWSTLRILKPDLEEYPKLKYID